MYLSEEAKSPLGGWSRRPGRRSQDNLGFDPYRPILKIERKKIVRLRLKEALPIWRIARRMQRTRYQIGRVLAQEGVPTAKQRRAQAAENYTQVTANVLKAHHKILKLRASANGTSIGAEARKIIEKEFTNAG